MIVTSEAEITRIALHKVGNKSLEESLQLSKNELKPSENIKQLLATYFLSSFKSEEYYHLHHESNIKLNEVYAYTTSVFESHEAFFEQSANLAKHLYEKSMHPKIKAGEFYVVYITGCVVDGEMVDAIGLFKSESKETYLKVYNKDGNFSVESDNGINIHKLDKGCLIFNTEKENGYLVATVDNLSKGAEATYWMDDFLKVLAREDNYFYTENMMSLCKNFVLNKLPDEYEVDRADQADMLNKSVKYLKEKDVFDMDDFANEVIQEPQVIDSFKKYKQDFASDFDVNLSDSFEISGAAVKKQARRLRSVIKLDKNFHIYVHGNRQYIEKGYDEQAGMHFYKVYFNEES